MTTPLEHAQSRLHTTNQSIMHIAVGFETEMKNDVFTGEQVGKILRGIVAESEKQMAEHVAKIKEEMLVTNRRMIQDELLKPPIRRTKDIHVDPKFQFGICRNCSEDIYRPLGNTLTWYHKLSKNTWCTEDRTSFAEPQTKRV